MHLAVPDLTQMPHQILMIRLFDKSYLFRRTFSFDWFEAAFITILYQSLRSKFVGFKKPRSFSISEFFL